jgi:transposase
MKTAPAIQLSDKERETLEIWARSHTIQKRFGFRANIVLLAAKGLENKDIAQQLHTRSATVCKWRGRFALSRLKGLQDAKRPGSKAKYNRETERRVLSGLDEPPPKGYTHWDGPLLAKALGDVSVHQVWRILRKYKICLARRHSWCISTDPEFTQKAADIVGLYLAPPENAIVLSVDEKPAIQALERHQGYLRLPSGKAITGFSHEYKRHGITNLFTALEVATGKVRVGHFKRKRRREFLAFMNDLVGAYPDIEIHVILDNLRTHKPKHDLWLARHPNVHFHYTPTHASWMNQVEIWFSILEKKILRGASWTSPQQICRAIDDFCEVYNEQAHPFEWTKAEVHQGKLKYKYADLCK